MKPEPFTYSYYRNALERALEAKYQFGTFDDAAALAEYSRPACLLRHDCDNDLGSAHEMAKIEAEYGIKSTYFIMLRSTMYNALSWTAGKHITALLDLGHSIGLHFDEELARHLSVSDIRDEIDMEREILRRYYGAMVSVVSFHRPGPRVLSGELSISQINTYSQKDVGAFQYVSDSSNIMRIDLPRALETAHFPKLHLNLHPEWWGEDKGSTDDRWREMLQTAFVEREAELWAREDAYLTRVIGAFTLTSEKRDLPVRLHHQTFTLD